jgi:glycosyltransferase involved in cell wall biosynthesis
MRILIIHNHYLQSGGEDEVVESEKAMLEKYGHDVILYQRSNREIQQFRLFKKIKYFVKDIYGSDEIYKQLRSLIKKEKPEIAHVHNTFYLLSPSVYEACYDEHIPVVQTLHNYRFLCPVATFYRDGKICQDCLRYGTISAIKHKCWKNSAVLSWILVKVIEMFNRKNILSKKISHFIALSQFSRNQFLEKKEFPSGHLSVKPNFVDNDFDFSDNREKYGLYVGGFFPYKGIETLTRSLDDVKQPFHLKLIGDGDLFAELRSKSYRHRVEFLGRLSFKETNEHIKKARFVIVPSECFENFPRVIVESYACGVPVIASRIGAIAELVKDHETGLLFEPKDVKDLAEKINFLISHDEDVKRLGQNAYREYKDKYTMEKNYQQLLAVYKEYVYQN